jgi:hypothetical protein
LIAACAQSDVSREEDRLRTEKATLITEQQRLFEQLQKETLVLKREATALCSICQVIAQWTSNEMLQKVIVAADELYRAYASFEDCTYEVFAKSLAPFERAQDATAAFMIAVRDAAYEVRVMLDEGIPQWIRSIRRICRNKQANTQIQVHSVFVLLPASGCVRNYTAKVRIDAD